jgi:hypothetical protein
MTRGSSILAYLVFGLGRTSTERVARPISTIIWRSLGEGLGMQCKTQRDLIELGLAKGLFKPTLYVIGLENNPETQPLPIKGWEGDPAAIRCLFPPSTRALDPSRAPHPRLDPIYALAINTTTVITPAIKSDKKDVGHYPTRGPNLGKTYVSLCRLIAVEFVGSHIRSMNQKPSSMGIAGVEPHHRASAPLRPALSRLIDRFDHQWMGHGSMVVTQADEV